MVDKNQFCLNPHVGVAVIVTTGQKVLFGKRAVEAGNYHWQLPGGWLETGETPENAARREVREETGLELAVLQFVAITNNIFSDQSHSLSLYFEAECVNSEAVGTIEPKKCHDWIWKDWSEVLDHLYFPLQLLRKTDYRPHLRNKQRVHVSF